MKINICAGSQRFCNSVLREQRVLFATGLACALLVFMLSVVQRRCTLLPVSVVCVLIMLLCYSLVDFLCLLKLSIKLVPSSV